MRGHGLTPEPAFSGDERFRIVRPLGEGGMGAVYEAEDRVNQEHVALKTIRVAATQYLYYLKREFRTLQGVEHPNLIRLGELIEDAGRWFFTMELIEGDDLLKHCRRALPTEPARPEAVAARAAQMGMAATLPSPTGGQLQPTESATHITLDTSSMEPPVSVPEVVVVHPVCDAARVRACLGGVADGLEALHGAGLIHRDVKPSNLMVGGDGRVVILDFGLVQDRTQIKDYLHAHDSIAGTPVYMSPEQLRGDALSPASDWYGIGVSLYEALTGHLPFTGNAWQLLRAKREGAFDRPSRWNQDVPTDLEELCVGLLSPEPTARPTAVDVRRMAERSGARARAPSTPPPLPSRPEVFVGRTHAVELLVQALEDVKPGQPVVALVTGPSGMGKSALVRRFVEEAERRGAAVLEGRVIERETVPYKAFDSLVDEVALYVKNLVRSERKEAAPEDSAALARVFPVLDLFGAGGADADVAASGAPGVEATELRTRGFASLRALLGRLAARRPLVLCIDDLQWGDRDSALLLRELLAAPAAPGVLMVLTCRSESEGDAVVDELLRAAAVAGPVRRIDLAPLDEDASAALARDLAHKLDAPSTAVAEVVREARGSPFLINEIVQHLATAPDAVVSGVARDDRAFLRRAVAARLERLDAETRRLVRVAAVFGRPAPRELLFAAAGLARGEGQRAVASGEAAHLLRTRPPDRVDTYHDRLRGALLDGLERHEERETRHALAVALESRALTSEELLGLDFIGETDPARARRLAVRAAKLAERALAFDRAASLYAMAAELGLPAERPALRKLQADALAAGGFDLQAARLYESLVPEVSDRDAADLVRRAAGCLLRAGHVEEGIACLTRVAHTMGVTLGQSRTATLFAIARQRVKLAVRGLGYRARAEDDCAPAELARLDTLASAATTLGTVDFLRGAILQGEHLVAALDLGEERRICRALCAEVAYLAATGHRGLRRADTLCADVHALAERLDDRYLLGAAQLCDGYRRLFRGMYPPAYEHFRAAEQHLKQCPGAWWERCNARHLAHIALGSMGDFKVLADTVPRTIEDADRRDDRHTRSLFRGHPLVWLLLRDDRPEEAERELEVALEGWPSHGTYLVHYIVLSGRAMIRLYQGQAAEAARLLREGDPILRTLLITRMPYVMGDVWKLRGQAAVARGDRAAAEEAIAGLERINETIGRAYASSLRAPLALASGDRREAERRLSDAIRAFQECGATHDLAGQRHRLGELVGGARGEELKAQAAAWMVEQEVRNPARMLEFLAPGYGRATG